LKKIKLIDDKRATNAGVVCRARGNDLLYIASITKTKKQADIVFKSIKKFTENKIVKNIIRLDQFNSLGRQVEFNAAIASVHFDLVANYGDRILSYLFRSLLVEKAKKEQLNRLFLGTMIFARDNVTASSIHSGEKDFLSFVDMDVKEKCLY
jgi:hypothetical protein